MIVDNLVYTSKAIDACRMELSGICKSLASIDQSLKIISGRAETERFMVEYRKQIECRMRELEEANKDKDRIIRGCLSREENLVNELDELKEQMEQLRDEDDTDKEGNDTL